MLDIEKILTSLDRGSPASVMAEARDPAIYDRRPTVIDASVARARKAASEPIKVLPWSVFRLFRDVGTREYDRLHYQRREDMGDCVVAILAGRDGDGAILRYLEDLLWAICDECTWCLPAHLPTEWPMETDLDLLSCETGFYIAETLHLLGDRIDGQVAARCRREIKRRVLDSYLSDHPVKWWESGVNNWGAVCAGTIGMTFLYEEPSPERRRTALRRVLAIMDRFLDSFAPDGACLEGTGYWGYGFGFFTFFADFLLQYTGGETDLLDDPRVHEIALFPQRVALSERRTVSFEDCGRFASRNDEVIGRLMRKFGDIVPSGNPPGPSPAARECQAVRRFLWCDDSRRGAPPPDGTQYLPFAQICVVRRAPFAFGAIFGHNGYSHNHNDVGTFLIVNGDEEGPMDLGSEVYTRQNFTEERYTFFRNGSQGHSVPIIGGQYQKKDGPHRARNVSMREENGETIFSGDIAGAYGLEGLSSLRRTFRVAPGQGRVTVTDSVAFSGAPMPVTERFVGYARAEAIADGEVRFGAFTARFDPSLPSSVHIVKVASYDKGGDPVDVFVLDIELPPGTAKFTIDFTPVAGRP